MRPAGSRENCWKKLMGGKETTPNMSKHTIFCTSKYAQDTTTPVGAMWSLFWWECGTLDEAMGIQWTVTRKREKKRKKTQASNYLVEIGNTRCGGLKSLSLCYWRVQWMVDQNTQLVLRFFPEGRSERERYSMDHCTRCGVFCSNLAESG